MPIPQSGNNIHRVSAQQQIYNALKTWIIEGTLQPGEYINDSEIAKYFSVSRTPVREAILLLARQDLLEIIPSKGTRVTETSLLSASYIYEAVSCLSAEIARLAVRKKKDGDVVQLKKLNGIFSAAVGERDSEKILNADTDFHNYILDMADNPYIKTSWQQLIPHTYRYELLYFRSGVRHENSVDEHVSIIAAIEAGDEGEAARCSQQNWIGFFDDRLKPQLSKSEEES